MNEEMSVLIYQGKNGTRVDLKSTDGYDTIWATQEQIASIFEVDRTVITKHIKNIINESELMEDSVCAIFAHTATDGKTYNVRHYNLDMIIAVGYRVNSAKATQFRIWATKILKEYIIKGFAMDDERLKDPKANQYFRELLERVREIRSSEKLFYQQVKDIYATAIDYEEKKGSRDVVNFFAEVQNKLHFAITGHTAAKLVVKRHDVNDKNFGLTNFKNAKVRLGDICIAKNYYTEKELKLLSLVVTSLLDHLEIQSQLQVAIKLKDWSEFTDNLIKFNKLKLLDGNGDISKDEMEKIVKKNYYIYDANRKLKETEASTQEGIEDLKVIEKEVKEILKRKSQTSKSKAKDKS
jgi:hypothetical protein